MKVIVSGASGFIGRYVTAELHARGIETALITRDRSKLKNVQACGHVIEMDLNQVAEKSFERMGRPDVLIHLAWGGLPHYRSLRHFEVELPVQYAFLKQLASSGLTRMIVPGTCLEYGMQSGGLSTKSAALPTVPYAYAKYSLWKQLTFLQQEKSFDLVWPRLFYIYGAGQSKNSIYGQLLSAVSKREKVFNMSEGKQLRDYLPVEEVASQIVDLAVRKSGSELLNLCSGTPIAIRDLVESWLVNNRWNIELNCGQYPYPDYEPMEFWGLKK